MPKPTSENLESLRRHLQRLVEDEKEVGSKRGTNKRRHERHLYMVEARIKYVKRFDQLSTCPDKFTVYTKDLSRSGLSFLHEHEMYVGEIVQVEVVVENISRGFMMKLVRCRRAGLKVFDIAGEFITADEAKQTATSAKKAGKKPKQPPEATETSDEAPQAVAPTESAPEAADSQDTSETPQTEEAPQPSHAEE